ncbi:hypothetical protein [Bacteroides graminisolvens]|uniref:hypothetical protein n=1 Tax=Bacteroides graminisolvens TaxID=477666 RepID=UPI0023F56C42|nr:hypothetical protein [Bacteroides graminisolvens]
MNCHRLIISDLRGMNGIRTTLTQRIISLLTSKILRNWSVRMMGAKTSKNVMFYLGFQVRNPKSWL